MKYLSNHSRTIGAALSLAMFAAAVPAHAVERNPIIILSPGQLQNLKAGKGGSTTSSGSR